jgi:hypothetical protein
MTIKQFTPRSSTDAAKNLTDFVRYCKEQLNVLGEDLEWNAMYWKGYQLGFTKLGSPRMTKDETYRFTDPFGQFARAYVRYQIGIGRMKARSIILTMLRTLESQLVQANNRAALADLNIAILDLTVDKARGHFKGQGQYQVGRELQCLTRFLTEKRLIANSVAAWQTPIKDPKQDIHKIGAKADTLRAMRMPSDTTLDAVAEIFASDPKGPSQRFVSSACMMMMCDDMRVGELLSLPADLEVMVPHKDGSERYGWRFYSAKGFEGSIKYPAKAMTENAKAAVRRIREMTEEARKLSRWIENHADKPYRHANCPKVTDDQPLTAEQVCAYLGYATPSSLRNSTKLSAANGAHSLNSLWQWAMTRQPKDFPWFDKERRIKYSNALFCMRRFELDGTKAVPSQVILARPTVASFLSRISSRSSHNKTIFGEFGYFDADGKPLSVTTHMFRHWNDTLGERGALGQEERAKRAGRANPLQNRTYNHMSEWEYVDKTDAIDPSRVLSGPQGVVSNCQNPINREGFALYPSGPMHRHLYGGCAHDWILSPCEKFRDCLNCEESIIEKRLCKGVRLERLKETLAELQVDYAAAVRAREDGNIGVEKWEEAHLLRLRRIEQLISMIESPEIPDDARIRLRTGHEFSHFRRVIAIKSVIALENNDLDAKALAIAHAMLTQERDTTGQLHE